MSTNKFWLQLKTIKIAYGLGKINKNLSGGVFGKLAGKKPKILFPFWYLFKWRYFSIKV